VPDVKVHYELNQHYKEAELQDNLKQAHRSRKIPKNTKQNVIDRAALAYDKVQHIRAIQGHKEVGFTNALDGSEDQLLDREILHFWSPEGNDMKRVREQLIISVQHSYDTGEVTSWDDVTTLLEAYDPHACIPEGMEGFDDELESDTDADDDHDHADDHEDADGGEDCGHPGDAGSDAPEEGDSDDDGDDDHGGGGGASSRKDCGGDDNGFPSDGAESPQSAGAASEDHCGISDRDHDADSGRDGEGGWKFGERPPAKQEAKQELMDECNNEVIRVLTESAANMRRVGQIDMARQIEVDLTKKMKRAAGVSDGLRLHLRTRTIESRRTDEQAREQWREDERNRKIEKTKLEAAKVQLQIENAKKEAEHKQIKVAEITAKTAQLQNVAQQKLEKIAAEQLSYDMKHKFASAYARKLKSMSLRRVSQLKESVKHHVAGARRPNTTVAFPQEFWPQKTKDLRLVVVHHVSPETKIYASENFSWILCREKKPQELSTTHGSVVSLLAKTLERCLPSYSQVARRWSSQDLLRDSNSIADLAFVRGVWVYSQILGLEKFPEGIFSWPPDVSMLFSQSGIDIAQPVALVTPLSAGSTSLSAGSTTRIAASAEKASPSTGATRTLSPTRLEPESAMRLSKRAKLNPEAPVASGHAS
jgi:hypothetical protein